MLTPVIQWMARRRITQSQLAGLLGKTQPTINSILRGKTRLSLEDAQKIIHASAGELPPEVFLPPEGK